MEPGAERGVGSADILTRSAPWHERLTRLQTSPKNRPTKRRQSLTTARSESSAGAGSGTDPNAREAKSESKDDTASKAPTLVERLKSQHRALQAILDKRSGAAADPQDIARQFAAAWVPHDLIVREVFGSAPQKAGGAAEALAPSDIRKDLLNFLLVNLLEGEPREP